MEEALRKDKKICSNCQSQETYKNQWYYHNNKSFCKKCQNKLFVNPKWHPLTNNKRIKFMGKVILLDRNPRTGICSKCGVKRVTNLHHLLYDELDPLAYTIELCQSCHMTESIRLGQIYRK